MDDIPKHQKKAVRHKKWGLQEWSYWFKRFGFPHWYTTKKDRDAAYNNLMSKAQRANFEHYPHVRKIER